MIKLVIRPRESMSWDQFRETCGRSIALDGFVVGGPQWDETTLNVNFDHHSGVVREATMSTAMQVMFAIKGGLMERLDGAATVYINDPDQDTALATWLLKNYHLFDGTKSHPLINRLLALTDRLDITGGAYPMRLDDEILAMHSWVFEPYSELRISGALATANESVMRNCIEAVHSRLNSMLMGQCGKRVLREDVTVLHDSRHGYKVLDETGGNEARYVMFSKGMNAFVSIVARLPVPDSTRLKYVYAIGRRSRYIDFPLPKIYEALNHMEGRHAGIIGGPAPDSWGGSDIVGGSPRASGSSLTWQDVTRAIDTCLEPK
jgi:hypothetical protein